MRRPSSASFIALLAGTAFLALVGSAGTAAASCTSNPTCNPLDPTTGPCCNTATCEWFTNGASCTDLNDCTASTTCNGSHVCGNGSQSQTTTCRERMLPGAVPKNCRTGTCSGTTCVLGMDPCDDGIACTDDCQNATTITCHSLPHPPSPSTTPCDLDSNLCTIDKCNGSGACVFNSNLVCPNSNPPECRYDQCNTTTGACARADQPVDTPCTADNNQCSKDICNGSGNCTHPANTGGMCNDGNSCTNSDTCDALKNCNGTPRTAHDSCESDNNDCTFDYCDGSPLVCNHQYIDPFNGGTKHTLPCNDGHLCSDNTTCNQDQCTGGFCNSATTCPSCMSSCGPTLPTCGCPD